MSSKNQPLHKTSIGGQALIEGVMMRGVDKVSMCVRLPDKTIDKEEWAIKNNKSSFIFKTPIIRGIFNFIETMKLGYKCLMKSAEKASNEEIDQKEGKFEKFITEKFGDNFMKIFMYIGLVIGFLFSIILFMFLPAYIVDFFSRYFTIDIYKNVLEGILKIVIFVLYLWIVSNSKEIKRVFQYHGADFFSRYFTIDIYKNVLEGILKIVIFVLYLWIVSNSKEIKRVFQYHGAEHKSIACYEAHQELTVENVKKFSRFHPRCGTSFILIVIILSVIVFYYVSWNSVFIRTLLKVILLPLVVGIGYEIIKIVGRYDNILTRIISKPGLWLQKLTTKEPDDSQLEVAIAALSMVIPSSMEQDKW